MLATRTVGFRYSIFDRLSLVSHTSLTEDLEEQSLSTVGNTDVVPTCKQTTSFRPFCCAGNNQLAFDSRESFIRVRGVQWHSFPSKNLPPVNRSIQQNQTCFPCVT